MIFVIFCLIYHYIINIYKIIAKKKFKLKVLILLILTKPIKSKILLIKKKKLLNKNL